MWWHLWYSWFYGNNGLVHTISHVPMIVNNIWWSVCKSYKSYSDGAKSFDWAQQNLLFVFQTTFSDGSVKFSFVMHFTLFSTSVYKIYTWVGHFTQMDSIDSSVIENRDAHRNSSGPIDVIVIATQSFTNCYKYSLEFIQLSNQMIEFAFAFAKTQCRWIKSA